MAEARDEGRGTPADHNEEAEDPRDPAGSEAPRLDEALARARHHARAAVVEALEATRALIDVAAIATGGVPAEAHGVLSLAVRALERAVAGLGSESGEARALVDAVAEALDAEITRWERRADDDPDARAVLRAFLGLRELLWELGIRRANDTRARGAAVVRRERVQRVHVQG